MIWGGKMKVSKIYESDLFVKSLTKNELINMMSRYEKYGCKNQKERNLYKSCIKRLNQLNFNKKSNKLINKIKRIFKWN